MSAAEMDIVKRLRDRDAIVLAGLFFAVPVMLEAATEIERLRAALAERTLPEQVRKAMAGELGTHATKEGA